MIRLKRISVLPILLSLALYASAGNRDIRRELSANPNRYGGSSAPYELVKSQSHQPPKGYKPFYVSHFGRHGSRYHTSADPCPSLRSLMEDAGSKGQLTPLGKDVLERLTAIDTATRQKDGDLTRVGAREHGEIAGRMVSSCKRVFSGKGKHILAQSTTSPRVILSMASFCSALKVFNPSLDITCEAGHSTSGYLNHYTAEYKEYYKDGPWRQIRNDWVKANIDPSGLVSRLFTSAGPFGGKAAGKAATSFAQDLYSLAKIMPASGLGITLYDVFSEDELYALWQAGNMDQYMRKGPSPVSGGLALAIAKPLLQDFVRKACIAVETGAADISADLRFGHGEGLMPLAGLMCLEEASGVCSQPDSIAVTWQDYRVTTMASNIQWIFYRNRSGNVLVKILLNEREQRIPVPTDTWPYYRWDDVRAFYMKILEH